MSHIVNIQELEKIDHLEKETNRLRESGETMTQEKKQVIERNFRKATKQYLMVPVDREETEGLQYSCPQCGNFLRKQNKFTCKHCFLKLQFKPQKND